MKLELYAAKLREELQQRKKSAQQIADEINNAKTTSGVLLSPRQKEKIIGIIEGCACSGKQPITESDNSAFLKAIAYIKKKTIESKEEN